MYKFLSSLFIIVLFFSVQIYSQTADSTYHLKDVIVVGDKFEHPIAQSTMSSQKLTSVEISQLPVNSNIEAFKFLQGYSVKSVNGSYISPIISTRGFYGGGEAEYIYMTIDNIQINDIENGLTDWFLMNRPFANIEMVKGGSSALYGDNALGGVINLESKAKNKNLISAGYGSFNSKNFELFLSQNFSNGFINVFGNYYDSEGERKFNQNTQYSFGFNSRYQINSKSFIRFNSINNFGKEDLPGAVTSYENTSSNFYKWDENDFKKFRFNLGYEISINSNNRFALDVNYYSKNSSKIRTFTNTTPIIDMSTFTPIGVYDTTLYGDTKNNKIDSDVIHAKTNYFVKSAFFNTKAVIGAEYLVSSYNNKTFDLFNGFEGDYSGSAKSNDMIVDGSGKRNKASTYLNIKSEMVKNLVLNVGLRYDYLEDDYTGVTPDTLLNISNDALSPKLGLNYFFKPANNYNINVYVSYNRSFRAPTVEQLIDFDKLNFGIFLPIPGLGNVFQAIQADPFGNSLLNPQINDNFEFGTYQSLILDKNKLIKINGAIFFSKIENEIDFDVRTFKYENIESSEHYGAELGINLDYENLSAFSNYSFVKAESKAPGMENLQLKGIPTHQYKFGFAYGFAFGLNVSLAATSVSDTYFDELNQFRFPDFTIWDTKFNYNFGPVEVSATINNIFDKEYFTMGYNLDGKNYLYPMMERKGNIKVAYQF